MSDLSEVFEIWGAIKREKKAGNRIISTAILQEHGIEFESKNGGVHLVVRGNGQVVDFWPSTGKFIVRGGRTGRGVFSMIPIVQARKSA